MIEWSPAAVMTELRTTVSRMSPRKALLSFLFLGRNRFVQTGFRFYPETGFGFLLQIQWTV